MRTTVKLTITLILAGVFSAFSQNDTLGLERWKTALADNDEFLHALDVMDKNVIENARALIHNMQTKKALFLEMAKYHSGEIARSLASSEDYLTRLQKRTDIAMDEIQVAYYSGLHQHYRNAIQESRILQEELIKTAPVTSIIEMNAMKIFAEISKAGKEQRDLQLKMDITEPVIKKNEKQR